MKKNLLKSMLVALMVMVGGSAWADNYFSQNYEADGATADWKTSVNGRFDPIIASDDDGNHYLAADPATTYNNGATLTSNSLNVADSVKEFTMLVDLRVGSANNGTPVFTIKNAAGNAIFTLANSAKSSTKWKINDDNEIDLPNTGYKNASTVNDRPWYRFQISFKNGLTYVTVIDVQNSTNIADRFVAKTLNTAGGVGTMTFATAKSLAKFAIDNITVRDIQDGDVPAAVATSYTIKYTDGNGATIKDNVVVSSIAGIEVTASNDQIANFIEGDKKYIYVSGNQTITTVADSASNVITLVFREAATWNYAVKSSLGTTIKAGTAFEQDAITYYYPQYELKGDTLYEAAKSGTNPYYGKTFTLTSDNQEISVSYTTTGIGSVVFYKEAELIEGAISSSASNADIRCSTGAGAYFENANTIVKLPAGKYKMAGQVWGGAGTTFNATAKGNDIWSLTTTGSLAADKIEEATEFELTGNTDIIIPQAGNANRVLDYVIIKKTGDYVITPAYGTIWEDGETTIDTNENTNAEIAAAYFNNFAKANDTIRATVVVAAPARTAGPARIIATGNLSVFAGLNPIYEAANIPVGESTLDIALDNEDLAAIAEAGSLKFVYSNLTLKKVELLEGPEPFNPATAIVNNSFENCEAVAESIVTTANAAGTDYAAAGWALTQNGPTWSNAAVFAYGSTAQLNGVAIPAIAPEGCGEKALGVTVGWGGAEVYQSAEAITLPAGTYTLAAYAYNANPDASQMTSKLGFIPTEGEAKVSTVVSYASEAWTVDYVTFTLDAATEGKFQIGGAAISGGSGANAKVFFDQLVLTDAEGLASLQSKAVAANEAIVQAKIAANTALVAGATEANPVAAPFVVNGTFDTTTAPWKSTTGAQNQALAENQQGAFTGKFFENWNGSAFTGKIYQVAENIPNGVYKLNIAAFVNKLADPNESQYVFANADKTFLTTGEPTMYEVYTKVENNTMEFGLEQTTATANWMGIDNISLTYYGAEANIDNIKFAVMLQEVAEALNAKQSVKTKTALETALTNFNAEKTDANIEALKAALAAAKVSINSYRILETGVLPDNSLEGWTCTNTNTFHINTWSSEGNTDGSNMVTPFIENWCNTNDGYLGVGEIYYSLPGLDPGIYQFSALIRAYSESGNEPTGASLFAGNREKEFATGKNFEFNGMKGIYDTYAMACEVGEDGVFKFGIKIAENRNFNWMAFKNCRVAYVGAAITEESVNELAATMPEGKMNAEVKAAAEAATATAKATPNLENYEALAKAIAAAKASAAAYEKLKGVLDFIAEEVAKTNMYTAAAKATFDESIATAQKGYDEGTMSDADAAAFNYGSRLEGLLPTLLLSAFTSTVEGTPYINTWSTEGNNDGSNFKTPFYEYWTGDGNSLGANALTAEITNLPEGHYAVNVLVRVRMKNGAAAPATGITMNVNGETAVDVCTGTQVGETQLYLGEFTAEGDVYEEGVLKLNINVAAENNISWLAFKDAMYTRVGEVVGIAGVKSVNKLDGTVYNLNGQKVEKAQRGLYIVNGKKVVVK